MIVTSVCIIRMNVSYIQGGVCPGAGGGGGGGGGGGPPPVINNNLIN